MHVSHVCEVEVAKELVCLEPLWKCHDNLKCIKMSNLCNGMPDCEDLSDEKNCPNEVTPTPENFQEKTEGKNYSM